jgi:oligopeptidase A
MQLLTPQFSHWLPDPVQHPQEDTESLKNNLKNNLKKIEPDLEELIAKATARVNISVAIQDPNWLNALAPIDDALDDIHRFFSPISHLNAVKNSPELREVYESCLQKLSAFYTELGQREDLYQLHLKINENLDEKSTPAAPIKKQALKLSLRDFRLSGVHLPSEKKAKLMEIEQKLSELSSSFSNHVLDCTDEFALEILDAQKIEGLPEPTQQAATMKAESQNKKGWVLGLDAPTYMAVMTHAKDRDLREKFYTAYCTRASDQGPHDSKYNNQKLMDELLALKHEKAELLGFKNYVDYSLASKMAPDAKAVTDFLTDLLHKSRPFAEKEFAELQRFATDQGLKEPLKPWDVAYYSELYQQKYFDIDQEKLRKYFPVGQVLSGLFELVQRLFGIKLIKAEADVWDPAVSFYEIYEGQKNTLVGGVYFDLFAREKKRSGAWMDDFCGRVRNSKFALQYPIAFLTCNSEAGVGGAEATLTHDDVLTLFHEFGHGLQHLLTRIEVSGVNGINGVPWDAVELPSQFLENFAWEPEVISMISRHTETQEKLPAAIFQQLLKLKHFQAGMQMLRQIEFALFDLRIHGMPSPNIQAILDEVRSQTALIIPPTFNRFQNAFSHIFAGGYSAGYYSYKWAEVLSCDAYESFKEEGILNPETGARFRETILGLGGSKDAMEIFKAFRGREPSVDALLKSSGLT